MKSVVRTAVIALTGAFACATPESLRDRGLPQPIAEEITDDDALLHDARFEDLVGAWQSDRVTGTWAEAGLTYQYVFNTDGSWFSSVITSAIDDSERYEILVLRGSFTFDDAMLGLGDGAPTFRAVSRPGYLLLSSEFGELHLRAIELPIW